MKKGPITSGASGRLAAGFPNEPHRWQKASGGQEGRKSKSAGANWQNQTAAARRAENRKLKELAPIKVGKKLESDIGNLETLVQAAWSLYIGISITIIVYKPI